MRSLLSTVLGAVDGFQQRRIWLSFPVAVVRKASEDQAGGLAALIAYYGFLSVFPLLLVFAAVLGLVLGGDPSLKDHILHTAESSFPSLSGYLNGTISQSSTALGVGLAGALWAGLGVTRATERAMNSVWDVPLSERPNIWWSRVRGLGMLGLLGVTFLASTGLAALRSVHGLFGVATAGLAIAGSLILNLGLYALAFQVLTNRHLAWCSVLPGAAVGAAGWTLLQNVGSYYVHHELAHASQLYGSLAFVIGILAWIYLGARLTLYAGEVNVVLAYRLWPRSLMGPPTTEADHLAYRRQVLEAQRAVGEQIGVVFDSYAPATSGGSSGADTAADAAVDSMVSHLQAFRSYRLEASQGGDPEQRRVASAGLRNEAGAIADDLERLVKTDEALAAALRTWVKP